MSGYEKDAQNLNKALKSTPKDKQAIIQLVARRSNNERLRIKIEYEKLFKIDLQKEIETELKKENDFKDAIVSLFLHPIHYDCKELNDSMRGFGTDDDSLCEIITTRPNCVLRLIKQEYSKLYKETLEKDVKGDTSGSYYKLLIHLIQEKKTSNFEPDLKECEKIAQDLFTAGEKKFGTDEKVFIDVFGTRSPIEIAAIDLYYQKITGHNLKEAFAKEFSGDMKLLLTTLFDVSFSQSRYFANRLHEDLTKNKIKRVLRILITRKEIDLKRIRQFYYNQFQHELIVDINKYMKDDMQLLLLEFIKSH